MSSYINILSPPKVPLTSIAQTLVSTQQQIAIGFFV